MSKDHHIKLPQVNQKAMDNIDLIKINTNELIYALGLVTQKGNTEFEKKLKNLSLEKVFLSHELSQNKALESLAGIFAAKEAFFKAIGTKENWIDVWVEKTKEGRPFIKSVLLKDKQKAQLSISHAGEYAIAVVMIKNEEFN